VKFSGRALVLYSQGLGFGIGIHRNHLEFAVLLGLCAQGS
jgi:hypothetical protein